MMDNDTNSSETFIDSSFACSMIWPHFRWQSLSTGRLPRLPGDLVLTKMVMVHDRPLAPVDNRKIGVGVRVGVAAYSTCVDDFAVTIRSL